MSIQCQVTDESPVMKKMEITVDKEQVSEAFQKEYRELKKYVSLRGFRPGKAPLNVIEKYYGSKVKAEVLESLMANAIQEAVKENSIEMAAVSKIEPGTYEKGADFSFTVYIEVPPKIENVEYEGLEVSKKPADVEDIEVEFHLDRMRHSLAQEKTVEGRDVVERGDVVVAHIEAYDGDELLEDYSRENMEIEIDKDGDLEGLKLELLGKKVGEAAEIELDIGQDDPRKELRGKKIRYRAKIKELRETVLPDLDDEFAKDIGLADDLVSLRSKVKDDLLKSKRDIARAALEEEIKTKLVERNPIEVPRTLVKRRAETLVRDMVDRLGIHGMDMDLSDEKYQKLIESMMDKAEAQVKAAYLLKAVAEKEGVVATDEDVEEKIEKLAEDYKETPAKIKGMFLRNNALDDLKYGIVEEKTLAILIDKANISEETAEDQKQGEEAGGEGGEDRNEEKERTDGSSVSQVTGDREEGGE